MFIIVHTFTGPIYSGETTLEISGFNTIEGAIIAAEERCLGLGGHYEIITREPVVLVELDGTPLAEAA